jgi:hypothetical protein
MKAEISLRIGFNHINRFMFFMALCLLVFQSASAQNAAVPVLAVRQ